jgi:three-Cys-motif partner protein
MNYLPQYCTILRGRNGNLVYIDGFAGRGTYSDPINKREVSGSPLRALEMIAANEAFQRVVRCLFIERDPELAEQLEARVSAFCADNLCVQRPIIRVGEFAPVLTECMDGLERGGNSLAPTFLFADPCGVAGANFEALQRFMQHRSCELLLFFNIEGIRRILGLGDRMGDTLVDLLGSEERAQELESMFRASSDPNQREQTIVAYYETLLREEIGAQYITTFRVEHETKKQTSHYLIHVTRHPLGFRIMKEVMWKVGQTAEGPGLALEQASRGSMVPLFRPQWQRVKNHVLEEMRSGPVLVNHFYDELTTQPDNRLSRSAYRQALLDLEQEKRIVVLKKDGSGEIVTKRPAGTLGDGYYVRLANPPGSGT